MEESVLENLHIVFMYITKCTAVWLSDSCFVVEISSENLNALVIMICEPNKPACIFILIIQQNNYF